MRAQVSQRRNRSWADACDTRPSMTRHRPPTPQAPGSMAMTLEQAIEYALPPEGQVDGKAPTAEGLTNPARSASSRVERRMVTEVREVMKVPL